MREQRVAGSIILGIHLQGEEFLIFVKRTKGNMMMHPYFLGKWCGNVYTVRCLSRGERI